MKLKRGRPKCPCCNELLLPPTIICCIFHLLPPIRIRCITFYCHQEMNVAIVARATNFVTLQYFFDTMEHTTWQYGHIPTQLWGGNKAILQQVQSWQYSHIATMCLVATITHATVPLVVISMLATILRLRQFSYVRCKTIILQHHTYKDARTYCTVPNATTYQRPYIDVIDPYCNQNSHIATQYRRHDRAGSQQCYDGTSGLTR